MIKPIVYVITFLTFQFITIPSSYTQPRTILIVTGGYSFPMGDMRGEFGPTRATFIGNGNPDVTTYFLKGGIAGKHSLIKKGNLKFVGGVNYNNFIQNKNYKEDTVSVKYNQSILTLSAGAEWNILSRKSKIVPFAGIDLTANFFAGKFKETYGNDSVKELTLKPASRFGLQFNVGADIKLGQRIGAVFGVKYNLANLIGREVEGDAGSEYGLNDKEHTTTDNVQFPDRKIYYLQLYAGLSFYFGL